VYAARRPQTIHAALGSGSICYLLFSSVATAAMPTGRPTTPQPTAKHIQADVMPAIASADEYGAAEMLNGDGVVECDPAEAITDMTRSP
jgi:hypothetical protein